VVVVVVQMLPLVLEVLVAVGLVRLEIHLVKLYLELLIQAVEVAAMEDLLQHFLLVQVAQVL
jgi:hypothetical protein